MQRLKGISSFIVMDIVKKAREQSDSIHFEIGEPDLKPNKKVELAAIKALQESKFGYTQSLGLQSLREKIAKHYKSTYGVDVDYKNIIITPGTSGAF